LRQKLAIDFEKLAMSRVMEVRINVFQITNMLEKTCNALCARGSY